MSKPTVGRVVHFLGSDGMPQAAMVVQVWSDTCVNLVAWNSGGTQTFHSSVVLGTQPGEWMWPTRV